MPSPSSQLTDWNTNQHPTYPGNSSTGVSIAENSRLLEAATLRGADAAARTRLAMLIGGDENVRAVVCMFVLV